MLKRARIALRLVVDDQQYTYAQLARAAASVASWLRSRLPDAAGGARVGILAARSFETYAGILGVCWASGTYVPLNPKLPDRRLAEIVDRADLQAIIADRRGAAHLPRLLGAPSHVLAPTDASAAQPAASITSWQSLAHDEEPLPPAALAPDHPAYIIFTSGTTGVPKGVTVSVSNVLHYLACMRSMHHLGPADRVAQYFDTSFDVSVSEMFICWDGGAALYVVPETKVMGPAGFFRQHEITFWMSVPSAIQVMQRMKQAQPGAFPAMRVSIFGGEGFTTELARIWQAAAPNSAVYNLYGPTEVTVACLLQRFTDPPVETPQRGMLAIGRPYPGLHAVVLGANNEFLKIGEIGELAINGPQVALGYFGDEELTARRFPTLDHPTLGISRWYLTGDLAYRDAQGFFHCLGRIDHQVKVMGHRVELEEVEAHLRAVCMTQAVAAVGWPVVDGHVAGIVGFVSGSALVPAAVRDQLRDRMPLYMIPSKVLTLDRLPLSSNGKVDRQALRGMLEREGVA